jgi:LysR family hydrogen peroxide-inducible transcriptional activator
MNLRDLRYLVAVAEHKHFGRAAEACFVSQPTLSTQLKKLEETLGVTLIERTNRQVMLSPAGELIVAQAQKVLREVNNLTAMAEQHRDPLGGDFRLGVIPTIAPYVLPKILKPIRKTFPNLRLQLTEGQTSSLVRMLKQGDLDAVLLALPLNEENIIELPLFEEPFLFAVSRQHPKAKRDSVCLDDLQDEQVLLLEDGHCLRDQALEICNTHRAVENANFRATSIETLRQMVAAGVGITLMPQLAVPAKSGTVRYIPFEGRPPHRIVGLCWRSTSTRISLLDQLGDVLEKAVRPVLNARNGQPSP